MNYIVLVLLYLALALNGIHAWQRVKLLTEAVHEWQRTAQTWESTARRAWAVCPPPHRAVTVSLRNKPWTGNR